MVDNRPQADRILVARISGTAGRLCRWGALDVAQRAAAAAELRELAGDRGDLLAEVAGLALGTAESKGPEYAAKAEAVAGLCRAAGADLEAIPGWIEEGRQRRANAGRPSFSAPDRRGPGPPTWTIGGGLLELPAARLRARMGLPALAVGRSSNPYTAPMSPCSVEKSL